MGVLVATNGSLLKAIGESPCSAGPASQQEESVDTFSVLAYPNRPRRANKPRCAPRDTAPARAIQDVIHLVRAGHGTHPACPKSSYILHTLCN